jgi:gliding motility-associated-like protein
VITTAGCEADFSGNFAASPRPALTVSYADGSLISQLPLTMYKNDTIRLRANGVYDSVIWNQAIKSVLLNVVRAGNYTAVSYRDGCVSQPVSIGVIMNEFPYDPNLKVQNILTPNGDGYNDVWEISMLNAIRPARVAIYTRSGLNVLETNDYQNDWKGQYQNNPLPEGSYFYIIEGAGGEVFKGAITLIR